MDSARKRLFWRDHLTEEERATLDLADAAKAEWERLNALRPRIVNRAIQRAKYTAGRRALANPSAPPDRAGDAPTVEGKRG